MINLNISHHASRYVSAVHFWLNSNKQWSFQTVKLQKPWKKWAIRKSGQSILQPICARCTLHDNKREDWIHRSNWIYHHAELYSIVFFYCLVRMRFSREYRYRMANFFSPCTVGKIIMATLQFDTPLMEFNDNPNRSASVGVMFGNQNNYCSNLQAVPGASVHTISGWLLLLPLLNLLMALHR